MILKDNFFMFNDKCQKVVNFMLHLMHFCYLFHKLSREKPREKCNCPITLYLSYSTLLCRKWPQDTKQRRKTKKKYKEAERWSHLPPTRKGELAEAEASISTPSTR